MDDALRSVEAAAREGAQALKAHREGRAPDPPGLPGYWKDRRTGHRLIELPPAGNPGLQSGEEARELGTTPGVWYTVTVLSVQTTANAVFQTAYHVVWIPKYRRPILTGAVALRVRGTLRDIAERNGWGVLAMEIHPDHLHLFLSVPPTLAVATAVRLLKGASAR